MNKDKLIIEALNTADNLDGLHLLCVDHTKNIQTTLSITGEIVDLINRLWKENTAMQAHIDWLEVDNEQLRAEIFDKSKSPEPPPKKYIHCDGCDERIYFGDEAFVLNGYCGIYHSPECFCDAYADIIIVDEETTVDRRCKVYLEPPYPKHGGEWE
jgi:hypothetical protein